MRNCKGVTRQFPTILQLEEKGEEEPIDRQLYQKVIGQLWYISTCTRPDMAHAIDKLSLCRVKPTTENWKGVISVMKYLKRTNQYTL